MSRLMEQQEIALHLTPQQFAAVLDGLRVHGASRGSEKRRFTRMEVQAQVVLARLGNEGVSRRFTALTRDISANGVGLHQCLPSNQGEKFLICLPASHGELHLICMTTFCRSLADGLFALGAQFQEFALPAHVKQLSNIVEGETDRVRQSILT